MNHQTIAPDAEFVALPSRSVSLSEHPSASPKASRISRTIRAARAVRFRDERPARESDVIRCDALVSGPVSRWGLREVRGKKATLAAYRVHAGLEQPGKQRVFIAIAKFCTNLEVQP